MPGDHCTWWRKIEFIHYFEHLKVHHPKKLRQFKESEKAAAKAASKETSQNRSSSMVITLKDCLERSRPYPVDHPLTRKITSLIGKMVVVDCQPFSIVEDEGFVKLVQPCYQIPNRKYFSTTLIPHMFKKCSKLFSESFNYKILLYSQLISGHPVGMTQL